MRENNSKCRIVNTTTELDGKEVFIKGVLSNDEHCPFYIIESVSGYKFNGYDSIIMIFSCLEDIN